MSTPLECPGCRRTIRIEASGRTGTVTCSRCKRVIVVHSAARQEVFNQELARALVEREVVTQAQIDSLLAEAAREGEVSSLSHLLIERGLVTSAQIRVALDVEGEMPLHSLPGYEIFGQLGQGGMGTVYRGIHTLSGKRVAIKVLSARLCRHKVFLERFHREARVAISLDHPNIAKGFDEGERDGVHYFVMEMIEGKSAGRVLARRGHFGERRSFHIVRQVALALGHAHERGLVHRDIKPDNILLTRDGAARLVDYGLVKLADDAALVNLTVEGQIMGTPHYISPEQASGSAAIDIRSDIYSLGATAYHMLTGSPPFAGENGAEVITLHLCGKLRDPRELEPKISSQASALVMKMMARQPEERHQTPAELLEEVEQYFQSDQGGTDRSAGASDVAGLEGESDVDPETEETPFGEWFTTPAPAMSGYSLSWWGGRLAGILLVFLLALLTLLLLVTPQEALPPEPEWVAASGGAQEAAAEAALTAAFEKPMADRLLLLESVVKKFPQTRSAQEAQQTLSLWRNGDRYFSQEEIAASTLARRLTVVSGEPRRAILRQLAEIYPQTPAGRKAASELTQEESRTASLALKREEEAKARERARLQLEAEKAFEAKERSASAALAKAMEEKKKNLPEGIIALQILIADPSFEGTESLRQAQKALSAILEERKREQALLKIQASYAHKRAQYIRFLREGRIAEALRTAGEIRTEESFGAYHPLARIQENDAKLLLAKDDFLFKGLASLIDTKVNVRMDRGEVLTGVLTGVLTMGEEPQFTVLKAGTEKLLTRNISKISSLDKIGIAQKGAELDSAQGALFAALMYLRIQDFERAAEAFQKLEEGEPARTYRGELLKEFRESGE